MNFFIPTRVGSSVTRRAFTLLVTASSVAATVSKSAAFDIPLRDATAIFAQSGFPASEASDGVVGNNNGWAVSPQIGTANRIWWKTDGFVGSNTMERYEFEFNFRGTSINTTYNINRFIVSYTTDSIVSNSSSWTPFIPDLAETSNPSAGTLSINSSNGEVSLVGAGLNDFDYFVSAQAQSGQAITGISVAVIPVSGRLGTNSSGNFILTEFTASVPNAGRIIVPEGIRSISLPFEITAPAVVGTTITPFHSNVTTNSSDIGSFPQYINQAGRNSYAFPIVNDVTQEDTEFFIGFISTSEQNYTPNRFYIIIADDDGPSGGYVDYVESHGLFNDHALPDADPNEDGISNIEAYAFRLNPAGPFPAAWRERLPRFVLKSGGRSDFPALAWQVPTPYPSDVRFTVQESTELTTWPDIATRTGYGVGSLWTGTSSASITDSGSPRDVVVPGSQNITSRPKAFLRLKLEHVPPGGGSN